MSRGITTSVPRDANRVPVTYGVSSVDGVTPTPIEVNPSTGQLLVSSSGGGGSITQYTDGVASPAHPIGDALVYSNGSNMIAVSSSNPLPTTSSFLNTNNTGTITGTGTFVVNTTSASSLSFQATGTWSGTITIEASLDGSNWISTSYVALASGNTSSNFSANTIGQINVTGLQNIRFRGSTVTGTANINTYLSQATSNIMLDNPLPQGTNVIGKVGIDQSTPGTSNAVSVTNTSFNASTPTSTQNIGQTTSNSTQVQVTASSLVPVNGMTIQALSANTGKIYVGLTGVTTSTGFELNPGQQQQFSPANANLMYIIGSNNTDKVCWLVA